jgi:hypothetical protein
MLSSNMFHYNFFLLIQGGFYIDFFCKKSSEFVIRNVLIYTALFFGEKYIIEVLTKKILDSFVFNSNKYNTLQNINYSYFFYTLLMFFFGFICLLNFMLYINY